MFTKFYKHSIKEKEKYKSLSANEEDQEEADDNEEDLVETDTLMGQFYCHVNGCIQEENGGGRNTATNHNCSVCKRSVHALCCMRVLGLQVDGPDTPLFCSDCFE